MTDMDHLASLMNAIGTIANMATCMILLHITNLHNQRLLNGGL